MEGCPRCTAEHRHTWLSLDPVHVAKVQEVGLRQLYMTDLDTMTYVRHLLALPFLPAEYIQDTFQALQRKASTSQLKELTAYVQQKWTESTTWPPSSWSIFHRPVRTNNDVEGWHRLLNRFAQKGQLGFHVLLELLHQEAKIVCNYVS